MSKSTINCITLFTITALAVGLFSGCTGIKVQPDYDIDTDFSQYKIYRWDGKKQDNNFHAKNPFVHSAIVQEIDNALKAKRYTKEQAGVKADFIIDYQMSIATRQSESNSSISFGTGSYGRGGSVGVGIALPLGGSSIEKEVRLIINIVDTKRNKLVWRTEGTESISGSTAGSKTREDMREIAKKIMAEFPPKK